MKIPTIPVRCGPARRWILTCVSWLALTVQAFGATEVLQQFDGITSVDPYAGFGGAPPDPHGAVGPQGIIASVNLGLAYFSRDSTNHAPVWEAPLQTNLVAKGTNAFWSPNAGYTAVNISDTKVVFDRDSQRFFVIMQENPPGNRSFLNIAVSRASDPRSGSTADWFFYRHDVTDTWSFPLSADENVGIDYPGLAVDRRVLTVAFNAFALNQYSGLNGAENKGSRVFVFNKGKLIAGLDDQPKVWKNQAPFDLPVLDNDSLTIQPAQPIGDSDAGDRVFAVELHHQFPYFNNDWSIRLHVFNDPLGSFSYQYEDIPIDSPNGDPGGAPQPSGSPVDTVALRTMSACFFDGKVWTVYTQKGDNGYSVVHWVAILPRRKVDGGSILYQDGYIDSGPGVWTYLPALSAGAYGDLCLIYTQSSATEPPSIYFRMRPVGAPWDPPVKLQASSFSTQGFQASKGVNRWGDYAAVAIDPVDSTFWVTHEYVNAASANSWATFWAQIAACHWPVITFPPYGVVSNSCVPSVYFSVGTRPVNVIAGLATAPPVFEDVFLTWRHNGIDIIATNRFLVSSNGLGGGGDLTILNPGFADEGFYDAKIVNVCGDSYAAFTKPVPLLLQPLLTWTAVETDLRPLNRMEHAMAYDQARAVSVLFGGQVYGAAGGPYPSNDTWLWDGSNWTPTAPALAPLARQAHAMAYDSQRQRVVLFGGYLNNNVTNIVFGDTWEWDGSNWQPMAAAGSNTPPARRYASMAYDPVRGETLLTGGDLLNREDRIKTWAWNGTNWTLRSTNFPVRIVDAYLGPYDVDHGNAMAFDERRGVMVLFAPLLNSSGNLVLEWGGNDWTAVAPVAVIPAGRNGYSGVLDSRLFSAFYDPYRGMVACAGGGAYNYAIWYWDGRQYYGFDTQIDGAPASSTTQSAGIAFDRPRRALIWSGGLTEPNSPHRTREIRFTDAPVIIQGPSPVDSEPGQTITLRVAVSGGGPLSYQWYFNGASLAANARMSGVNSPTLVISAAVATDSGDYHLVVTGPCSSASSPRARVAVGPLMALQRTTTTDYRVSWTAVNATVEDAPTPLGPWTRRPDLTGPFSLPETPSGARFYRLRISAQ